MNILKVIFRSFIGIFSMAPFMLAVLILSVFKGRKKAVSITGKVLTNFAKKILTATLPKINNPDEFDDFKNKVKLSFKSMRSLYDVKIINENNDMVEFNVLNCPFTKTLKIFGFKDLCPHACAGDWLIAKENKEKWDFARQHTLGTDGCYCNHTYLRKNSRKVNTLAKEMI